MITPAMHKLRSPCSLLVSALLLLQTAGCTGMPYAASYQPLIDASNEQLVEATSIEHHWVDNLQELQSQSESLYQKGYAMVGYSSMYSTHLQRFAPSGALRMGKKVGAAQVYQVRDRSLYIATYWREVRGFGLGAYYVDAPASAHERLGQNFGVIVEAVVEGTPAADALLMPGDLLLSLNGQIIPDARWLDNALAELNGQKVAMTVWPMVEISPLTMELTLGTSLSLTQR